jgi:hypothetical protein
VAVLVVRGAVVDPEVGQLDGVDQPVGLVGIASVLLRLIAFLFYRQDADLRIGQSASQV